MKNLLRSIIVLAVVCFCGTVQAQSKKIAVLVGVDKYEKLTELQYPKNDVEKLRETLTKIGFESDNVLCPPGTFTMGSPERGIG